MLNTKKYLDININLVYIPLVHHTSNQVARMLGLPVTTLSTYINNGKIPRPKSVTSGRMTIYLWTEDDIERVRELLPKLPDGRKTRHRKEKQQEQKLTKQAKSKKK